MEPEERNLPAVEDILVTLRRKVDLLFDEAGRGQLLEQTVTDLCVCEGALGDQYEDELDFASLLFLAQEKNVPLVDAAVRGVNEQVVQVLLTGLHVAHLAAFAAETGAQLGFREPLQRLTQDIVLLQDYIETA